MGHKITMYENLRDMIDRELGEIERKRDIDQQSLDNLYKLTMSLKAINKAIDHTQMDESGMSIGMGQSMAGHSFGALDGRPVMQVPGGQIWNRMPYMRSNEQSYDNSYGMSYDGQSMARRGRDGDSDGRYNESRGQSMDGGMGQSTARTYGHEYDASRDASKKKMAQKLETLMDDTMSEKERAAIQECIQKIRQQ